MKSFLCGFAVLMSMTIGMIGAADAGWGGYGNSGYSVNRYAASPSYGSHSGYGYGNGYSNGNGYGNYGQSFGGHGRSTHLDYHPPTVQRHFNHYDVVPGHYDLHRGGHGHW